MEERQYKITVTPQDKDLYRSISIIPTKTLFLKSCHIIYNSSNKDHITAGELEDTHKRLTCFGNTSDKFVRLLYEYYIARCRYKESAYIGLKRKLSKDIIIHFSDYFISCYDSRLEEFISLKADIEELREIASVIISNYPRMSFKKLNRYIKSIH
jgi:hypothetical protein